MPSDVDHNKLIKQAANLVLKPYGLFQKGSSRIWIDDNGWYLIVVEFQPSAWDKGSYLNVAIHYLWDEKDYLSFDYGHRVNSFVRFDGNETKFLSDMQSLAEIAMNKVMEYRQFRDLEYAKTAVLKSKATHIIHTLYQRMMICGLCRDKRALDCYNQLMQVLGGTDAAWASAYYSELSEKLAPIVGNSELLHSYIQNKIGRQRSFWRAKASMKKLSDQFGL